MAWNPSNPRALTSPLENSATLTSHSVKGRDNALQSSSQIGGKRLIGSGSTFFFKGKQTQPTSPLSQGYPVGLNGPGVRGCQSPDRSLEPPSTHTQLLWHTAKVALTRLEPWLGGGRVSCVTNLLYTSSIGSGST